jgi:hypothetical protein
MKLRAYCLLAVAALSLSAVACTTSASGEASSSENESAATATESLSTPELKKELAQAVDGIEYTSESDYPFDVFVAPGAVGAKVDADAIKTAFNDLVTPSNDDEGLALKDMPGSEVRDFEEWMDVSDIDESDESSVAYAKGMTKAHDLMKANLDDLQVILVASESLENTEDVGFLHCFIVGRAKDGSLVALHTGLVWT